MKAYAAILMGLALVVAACGADEPRSGDASGEKGADAASTIPDSPDASLTRYDVASTDVDVISVGQQLRELSGLALGPGGRLFGHNDEQGMIYEIGPDGKLVKSFTLGLVGDFEDLEFVDGKFYLVSNAGDIYEFEEGDDGEKVAFTKHETPLTVQQDVEGICHDPSSNALLLACKEVPLDGNAQGRAVYAFSLESKQLDTKPRFVLPYEKLAAAAGKNKMMPSAIRRHPSTGTFYVLSSNDPIIVELSPSGEILAVRELPKDVLTQPEGLVFTSDGTMMIGSEGKKKGDDGVIAKYGGG